LFFFPTPEGIHESGSAATDESEKRIGKAENWKSGNAEMRKCGNAEKRKTGKAGNRAAGAARIQNSGFRIQGMRPTERRKTGKAENRETRTALPGAISASEPRAWEEREKGKTTIP
jgi:hypothetical protein